MCQNGATFLPLDCIGFKLYVRMIDGVVLLSISFNYEKKF